MNESVKANAAKLAASAPDQKPQAAPSQTRGPLVYLTEHYNCYDRESTRLCRHLANRLVKERHARPQDADWLVDRFRDELAAIMSAFVPGGSANAHTFANARLPRRLNNVWEKYKSMCRHCGGRLVSMSAPSEANPRVAVEDSAEFTAALLQAESDRQAEEAKRLRLERMARILEDMPQPMRQICQWIMEGNTLTRTAELFGITCPSLVKTWIPKIRAYFVENGLFDGEDDYER